MEVVSTCTPSFGHGWPRLSARKCGLEKMGKNGKGPSGVDRPTRPGLGRCRIHPPSLHHHRLVLEKVQSPWPPFSLLALALARALADSDSFLSCSRSASIEH